jgi:hypothetical protein
VHSKGCEQCIHPGPEAVQAFFILLVCATMVSSCLFGRPHEIRELDPRRACCPHPRRTRRLKRTRLGVTR